MAGGVEILNDAMTYCQAGWVKQEKEDLSRYAEMVLSAVSLGEAQHERRRNLTQEWEPANGERRLQGGARHSGEARICQD